MQEDLHCREFDRGIVSWRNRRLSIEVGLSAHGSRLEENTSGLENGEKVCATTLESGRSQAHHLIPSLMKEISGRVRTNRTSRGNWYREWKVKMEEGEKDH